MRLNIILEFGADVDIETQPPHVQEAIAGMLVGRFVRFGRDYNGRAIAFAQVDVGTELFPTLTAVEAAIAQLGLDWTIPAAQAPYATENIGSEEEPVIVPVIIKAVPANIVDYLADLWISDLASDDTLVASRPEVGQPLLRNAGDNSWVWE